MNDKKKKGIRGAWSATFICFLVALIFIIVGYVILWQLRDYQLLDFLDSVVGNLIGVFGGFCIFDILYNKLTQEEATRETSQHITRALMGDPETIDAFSDDDKKNFLQATLSSMMKDDDAVDMLVTNMGKYFDNARGGRIRKYFDYTIELKKNLPEEYKKQGFPGWKDQYYMIDEEFKFRVKYLGKVDESYNRDIMCIGFAYDKRSLDHGLLETGGDADFSQCIFNEDLVISKEAIDFINSIPQKDLRDVIDKLFVPIMRIDNSGDDDNTDDLLEVERKTNGLIFKFKVDYEHSQEIKEHAVSIYFKMPRLWDSIFEVTLVDPCKEPHIKLKYDSADMDVTMYSYLNKEIIANSGACIKRAGLYDIAIKNEWIYPKSGVIFNIKKNEKAEA